MTETMQAPQAPRIYTAPAAELAARAATRPTAGRSGGELSKGDVILTTEQLGADVPAWAKEQIPDSIEPYVGRKGTLPPWNLKKGILASTVAGLDRWEANRFVCYRPETAEYLYTEYTPLKPHYKLGTFPKLEQVVAQYTKECKTDTDKAVALVTKALANLPHPTVAPKGAPVKPNRNLSDEQLYTSGSAWCNEQARVFITMCNIAGIPARLLHLFYSDTTTGHSIAEFYADGAWHMADASYLVVFPGKDGKLMSAPECHQAANKPYIDQAYRQRYQAVAAMSDEKLGGKEEAAKFRATADKAWQYPASLDWFAVINHYSPQ